MSESKCLTTEQRGHVYIIGLNRPDKRNAFNLQMLRELSEAFTLFEQYPEAHCALLFAHGDHFTAGLDLAEVGPAVADGQTIFPAGQIDPLDMMEPRRTKPVVIAVQGYCFTIGVELCLAGDIRLAARDTIFAQMEVCRGIMPFGGGTMRWPQVAGWGNAMRYLLTGERFDAAEAFRIGLVQELCDKEQLFDRALALADLVARQAPLAVKASRVSAQLAMEKGWNAALSEMYAQARALMGSEDAYEGMLSFIERRPAAFKGK